MVTKEDRLLVHSGNKTVTTHGTRVALASTRTAAAWLIINAKQANTGLCYVGDNTVAAGKGTALSKSLLPVTFPPLGNSNAYDLSLIYVDSVNDGDGVEFNYGTA